MAEDAAPKELFISYGREPEVSSFVGRLKSDLERNGFSVWLDHQVSEKIIIISFYAWCLQTIAMFNAWIKFFCCVHPGSNFTLVRGESSLCAVNRST